MHRADAPRHASSDDATRVLVADDDRDIRDLVAFKLGQAGYEVETAEDGVRALAQARSTPPSLVVLDVMMPGLSGLDVARQLRADPAPPRSRSSCSPRKPRRWTSSPASRSASTTTWSSPSARGSCSAASGLCSLEQPPRGERQRRTRRRPAGTRGRPVHLGRRRGRRPRAPAAARATTASAHHATASLADGAGSR